MLHFKWGKNGVRYIPRVKLKIQKSGLGGKRKINNLALRITKACQSASFKRNKRVYKDPRSFLQNLWGFEKIKPEQEKSSEVLHISRF